MQGLGVPPNTPNVRLTHAEKLAPRKTHQSVGFCSKMLMELDLNRMNICHTQNINRRLTDDWGEVLTKFRAERAEGQPSSQTLPVGAEPMPGGCNVAGTSFGVAEEMENSWKVLDDQSTSLPESENLWLMTSPKVKRGRPRDWAVVPAKKLHLR
eukprot:EG_transcript_17952